MKDTFKEFYKPDYEQLWSNCTFVFDTNVLLNLYRYKDETKKSFFKILEKIGENKWLPYQVGYEYHKNRLMIILDLENKLNSLDKNFEKNINQIRDVFNEINNQSTLTNNEQSNINKAINTLKRTLTRHRKKLQEEIKKLQTEDLIQKKIIKLFEYKIGKNYTSEELEKLYKIAEDRFNKKIPPGFCDIKKNGNDKYSDYIIWQEILDYAKKYKKCIIFVTADEKEDWWHIFNGNRYCSPILKKEFYNYAGTEFHMYTPELFINEAIKFYNLNYSENVIKDVESFTSFNFPFEQLNINYKPEKDFYFETFLYISNAIMYSDNYEDVYKKILRQYKNISTQYCINLIFKLKEDYDITKELNRTLLDKLTNHIINSQKRYNQVNLFEQFDDDDFDHFKF